MIKKRIIFAIIILVTLMLCGCVRAASSNAAKALEEGTNIADINDEKSSEEHEEIIKSGCELVFLNTGKSDCIIIEAEGLTIINDTADADDYDMINEYLRSRQIEKVDYMILSHFDKDHIGSAGNIIRNYSVENIIMPSYFEDSEEYMRLMDAVVAKNVNVLDSDFEIEKGKLHVIIDAAEEATYKNENNHSLITSISYGNNAFLLLGDALKIRMQEFMDNEKIEKDGYSVIKLPHHGEYNKLLKDIVKANAPFKAVITDDASMSRVSDKTIELLEENDCDILFTYNGTIKVKSDGNKVETEQE